MAGIDSLKFVISELLSCPLSNRLASGHIQHVRLAVNLLPDVIALDAPVPRVDSGVLFRPLLGKHLQNR